MPQGGGPRDQRRSVGAVPSSGPSRRSAPSTPSARTAPTEAHPSNALIQDSRECIRAIFDARNRAVFNAQKRAGFGAH